MTDSHARPTAGSTVGPTVGTDARAVGEQAGRTLHSAAQTARTARRQFGRAVQPVEDQARQTLRAAEKTVGRAEHTMARLLRDGAYASVGATDAAVALLRALPGYAERARAARPAQLTGAVEREFDRLTVRGRDVVASVQRAPATRRAVDQTRATRQQLRTAAGQVRRARAHGARAAEDVVAAAEDAAGTVGRDDR